MTIHVAVPDLNMILGVVLPRSFMFISTVLEYPIGTDAAPAVVRGPGDPIHPHGDPHQGPHSAVVATP